MFGNMIDAFFKGDGFVLIQGVLSRDQGSLCQVEHNRDLKMMFEMQ